MDVRKASKLVPKIEWEAAGGKKCSELARVNLLVVCGDRTLVEQVCMGGEGFIQNLEF